MAQMSDGPRRVCASCGMLFVERWYDDGVHWPRGDTAWDVDRCDVCGCGGRCTTSSVAFGGHADMWKQMPGGGE